MKRQLLFIVMLLCATTVSWAATITVGPGGPPTYNFATIQAAVNASAAGDVISIAPGITPYFESNILVDKSITIQGIGATRDQVVIAPAAYDGNVDNAFDGSAQNGFIIKAHGVLIRKLTINGNGNPALTTHGNNFRAGIVTLDASQPGGGAWINLHVDNVVIKNVWRRGVSVFPRTVTGTFIENSWIENVVFNQGMYLAGQSQVTYNTVKHCFQGIVLNPDNSTPEGPSVASFKINNNTLTEIGNYPLCYNYPNGQPRAIQFDPVDPVFKTVEIKYNTIDDIGSAAGTPGTVGIYTRRASSTSIIDHNVIILTSGAVPATGSQSVGMLLGWSYTHGFMVSYNTVTMTGYGLGVLVFGSGTSATPMILERNSISSTGSVHSAAGDGTGIYIANQYLYGASNKYGAYVLIQNRNTISGFARGIDLDKIVTPLSPITVIAHMNKLIGNATGIDASTMGATVDVIDNYWGFSNGPYNFPLNTGGSLLTLATAFDSFIPWWCDEDMTARCTPVSGLDVIMNLNTGVKYDATQLAFALSAATSGQTLLITGIANAPVSPINIVGKTVTIVGTGTPGISKIDGALTLGLGDLIIKEIEFTNTTNAPTILVTGGSLNLRKCTINATSGYTQAGLKVTGGTVDAGKVDDFGYNKFVVISPGSAIDNTSSPSPLRYAVGNNWGSPTGPTVATNPGGTGGALLNSVSGSPLTDYVIYRPWGGITMSGNFKYYNLANTLLTNNITVKLYQDNLQVGTDFTVTAGTYSFPDLVMGDYEVRTTCTKSVYGSVNSTDAAQVNAWFTVPYSIEKVRFYAGDVTGSTFYINATDALRIQKNFVYGTAFDRPSWTFWETGKTISSNISPSESYPIVTVGGNNKTANMYGLCTGDFNRSFIPALKSASSNLILNYGATRQIASGTEFDLPIRIVNATGVGAVSMILNFPADLVEVQDVIMHATGGQLDWTVKNNELRIGWNSQIPATFASLDNLVTLRLKTTASFTKGNSFRLTLASDPLNELANENFDVIADATLSVDVVEASTNGIDDKSGNGLNIRNYPNPFAGQTMITYAIPYSGTVTIQISNILGATVKTLVNEYQVQGNHSIYFDASNIAAGVYTATIKLANKTDQIMSTIKIVNNR